MNFDKNHLHLLFPYLDYGLNFFDINKNKIENYEEQINLNEIKLSEGVIIPNYKVFTNLKETKEIRLRNYLQSILEKYDYPIFFVIRNGTSAEDLREISLFSEYNNILFLKNVKYHSIINVPDSNYNFNVRELENIKTIIVRPDLVIQRII